MSYSALDSCLQANILLTAAELNKLELNAEIELQITQTQTNQKLPLKIYYLLEMPASTDKLPIDEAILERGGYIIYIDKKGIDKIKNREVVGAGPLDFPKHLRKIYMSLEDVF